MRFKHLPWLVAALALPVAVQAQVPGPNSHASDTAFAKVAEHRHPAAQASDTSLRHAPAPHATRVRGSVAAPAAPTRATPAVPATGATPATPATPATGGAPAVPATPATPPAPATPAVPAQPTTPPVPPQKPSDPGQAHRP